MRRRKVEDVERGLFLTARHQSGISKCRSEAMVDARSDEEVEDGDVQECRP